MSYITQAQDPRRRAAAIVAVAAIHAALGLGVVVGLTISGFRPEADGWDPFTITPDQPEPPPPPQPQQQQEQESLVTVPKPLIDLSIDNPLDDVVVTDEPREELVVVPTPRFEPATEPLPAPTFTPRGVRPSNSPVGWLSNDDYPGGALRDEAEGTAGYRLVVGTNGRVSACDITRSTGNGQLDDATCRLIVRRARFEAATDETGAKVVGSYTGTVRWEIPE